MAPDKASNDPVGSGDYVVRPGDCMLSIAQSSGYFWETLWNLPENKDLKDAREDPNTLLPGDRVTIPPVRLRTEKKATGSRYRFKLKSVGALVRVRLQQDGEAVAGVTCSVSIDGRPGEDFDSDGDGIVEFPVPTGARTGQLSYEQDGLKYDFDLRFGDLDPVMTTSGVAQRLYNLGFYLGPTGSDVTNEDLAGAIAVFQKFHDLEVNGTPDETTCDKLKEVHGS
jgi:N-acetylmuramoyl-L-alanine amidase